MEIPFVKATTAKPADTKSVASAKASTFEEGKTLIDQKYLFGLPIRK